MSERAINDPTVAGWELNPDTGYWMWAAEGGGGGSIQDGDTEGQITTWDGTEWTPEGAVVVDGGNVGIGTDSPASVVTSASNSLVVANSTGGSASASFQTDTAQWEVGSFENFGGIFGVFNNATASFPLTIGADGTVNITSSTDTTKLNIINSLGVYEVVNNEYGSLAVNYNGAEQLVLASNGDVYVTGKLFVSGVEVGGGGLWTDNGDGSISYSGTAKASDFVTT